jgi:hypothetical protein
MLAARMPTFRKSRNVGQPAVYVGHASTNRRAVGKVDVDRTVNRIKLDSSSNIEACLLEAKAQAACSSEQIDRYGTLGHVFET